MEPMRWLLPALLFLLPAQLWAQKVICIDPGHPSENGVGTRGKKITELDLCWNAGKKLEKLLIQRGYRVVMTKKSKDELVTNEERAKTGNRARADLVVRLHADTGSGSGFATYYADRPGTVRRTTGPSREVIARSKAAAEKFHPAAIKTLAGNLKDHGLRTEMQTAIGKRNGGALTGSIFSVVPVILLEMCFLSNAKDEEFVATAKGQDLLAKAIADGIDAVFAPKASGAREATRRAGSQP
jgi:N-acetylmuramoyl-L-alanine amidase